jgi:hypothetical protein
VTRPSKTTNVLQRVKECIDLGRYYDTRHGGERKIFRSIALPDVLYILKNGFHEKKKDEFKPEHNDWNYAIRGKTVDGRDIRIAVAVDENNMLIITVIDIKGSQR